MKELLAGILDKYGLKAIGCLILAVALIWVLAHYFASPGGQVSVLWGLVQYTKESSIKKEPVPSVSAKGVHQESDASIRGKDEVPLTPIRIISYPIAKYKTIESLLVKLRNDNKLRELTALESNKKLSEIPNRTYCYMSAMTVNIYNPFLDHNVVRFGTLYKPEYKPYEIHKISDTEINIMGFISNERAANDSYLTGTDAKQFVFSPIPLAKEDHLALIPIQRIVESASRMLDLEKDKSITVMDIKLK